MNLIYPGSFDPFHMGHADVIRRVYGNIDVDDLIVLLQHNRFKASTMFNETFKFNHLEECLGKLFPLRDIHVNFTSEDKFSSYWYITGLNNLKYKLVIGDDCLSTIHKWSDFDLMVEGGLELVVVQRGLSFNEIREFSERLPILLIIQHDSQSISNTRNISSTIVRNEINQTLNKYGRENVDQ